LTRVEKSIEIKVPPEKVWKMLALDRCPEWMDDLKSVKYTSEVRTPKDKYRVGATAHWIKVKNEEFDSEITESLENEKMTFRMVGKRANNTVVTYVLESVDEGTKFAYVMTFKLPWGILGTFLGKLGKGMLEKEGEKSLEKLKSILEK
jgi:uncharacterized membrane protein